MFTPCFVQAPARSLPSRHTKGCSSTPANHAMSTMTTRQRNRNLFQGPRPLPNPAQRTDFNAAKLILAPMEVLADHQFRKAISTIGGMDEAVHEFIRITHPNLEDIHGILRRRYNANETTIPLAAQIMGADPAAMEMATTELVYRHGAHRVDLNCGCPAKRVNGRGAGASLLKSPESVYEVTKSMVGAAGEDAVVSVKMRSGYDSTALFEENVCAVIEAGARMLTVHPRTKMQAYSGKADWELIRRAKEISGDRVEVIGNGDVVTAKDAVHMLDYTKCDHVMIGRGAVANPWIFWVVREAFARRSRGAERTGIPHVKRSFDAEQRFYEAYFAAGGLADDRSSPKVQRMKIGRLKMIVGYSSTIPEREKKSLLRFDGGGDARRYLEEVMGVLGRQYKRRQELLT